MISRSRFARSGRSISARPLGNARRTTLRTPGKRCHGRATGHTARAVDNASAIAALSAMTLTSTARMLDREELKGRAGGRSGRAVESERRRARCCDRAASEPEDGPRAACPHPPLPAVRRRRRPPPRRHRAERYPRVILHQHGDPVGDKALRDTVQGHGHAGPGEAHRAGRSIHPAWPDQTDRSLDSRGDGGPAGSGAGTVKWSA